MARPKQTRENTQQQLEQARESTRVQLEQARESQERTQRLTERGQITDRFTHAIDQLGKTDDEGNKVLEIRLGGIYALELIARESEEDHWPIMEILAAYVRQNAPLPPKASQLRPEDLMVTDLQRVSERLSEMSETKPSAPDADIQAIITILRRRKRFYGHGETEPLYLSETNLSEANLSEAQHLTQGQLEQAHGDEETRFPPRLKPPAHWGVKTDE